MNAQNVEHIIASELTNKKGVALAIPRWAGKSNQTNPLRQQIQRNYHPARSGDIYVVQDPYWFMFKKGPIAAMHGSPWRYDTHVPIIFAGPSLTPQKVHRLVHPVDVAPTLSALLGMSPPSATQGTPLQEVLH